ncbi:uncharacterized protein LOC143357149 [Halictus rubicundus]|uniref:uncharacterized protein LOC143357149 n=1 Tax=Halictus rubicundus TaxID=77578 RepID=UPI0040372B45
MSEIQRESKSGVLGRDGGKFSEYANTLRIVFKRWTSIRGQLRVEKLYEEAEELILPSNEDWRQRVYYGLVELQRACDKEIAINRVGEVEPTPEAEKTKEEQEEAVEEAQDDEGKRKPVEKSRYWEWEPRIHESSFCKAEGENCKAVETRGSASSARMESETGSGTRWRMSVDRIAGSMTEARATKPGWRVTDIVLAAEVLRKESTSLVYSDEAEMRRVFGLVYDVLRYKKIFGRALEEVGFWRRNGTLKPRRKIVWLLLYDMQGRKFSRRGEIDAVEEREKIFQAAGLMDIEEALLDAKTHLAASISRLRIRGSALSLDKLLPARLRSIEGVAWGEQAEAAALASGWVNSNKFASKKQFLQEMSMLNLFLCENTSEMTDNRYAFDPICPKMIELPEGARETLARSSLVRDHRFVFLERSLCLGAAALARAMRVCRFCGPVVLTHALAPRHTGYLAELLQDIQDAGRLLAFGTGEHRAEYETYLNKLGVTSQRCRVFSEKYVSPPATAELDRATVVLAIPPCSYTGVKDIVDLAVARGGDADLLESLTDACVADDDDPNDDVAREIGQSPRAHLADQMSTLKYALTRPNVQFVIYEAHTVLPSETTEMVRRVVDYANRMAVARHVRDQPSKKKSSKEEGESRGESNKQVDKPEQLDDDGTFAAFANVVVPDSDLFEVGIIDDIYGKNVSGALDPGCFLAVIKRKEMMQFDSLFMIKVAESKGLFGDPNEREPREKKREPVASERDRDRDGPIGSTLVNPRKRTKRRFDKIELERLIAHTHCSLTRTLNENPVCPRQERLRAAYEKNNPRVRETQGRGHCRRRRKNAATLVNVSLDDI